MYYYYHSIDYYNFLYYVTIATYIFIIYKRKRTNKNIESKKIKKIEIEYKSL